MRILSVIYFLSISGFSYGQADNKKPEIFPGISVYTGSRHNFNSQYVVVKTTGQNIVLASDNAYSYYNIEHSVSAPGYATWDTTGYVKQINKMKSFVKDTKYIIPGHDGLVFERFGQIADDIAEIK